MTDFKSHTLNAIFADTDNISFGPFKIIKKAGQDYKYAQFKVNDHPVEIKAAAKKIMALLISQQGEPVSLFLLSHAMNSPWFTKTGRDYYLGETPEIRAKAEENLSSMYQILVYDIRKAIKKAIRDPKEQNAVLDHIKTIRAQKGHKTPLLPDWVQEGGYALKLPAPH